MIVQDEKSGLFFPACDKHMRKEYEGGRTQLGTLERAMRHVTNHTRAVDGGMFIGLFSKELAKRFDHTVGFEPASDTYDCATANLWAELNEGKVEIINKALSNVERSASLGQDQRWEDNTGGRYLVRGDDFQCIPLDSLGLEEVGLIKLDIEGHEYYALQGAQDTIQRCRPVILCEEKARLQKRQGVSKHSIGAFLGRLGYSPVDKIKGDVIYVAR